MNHSYGWVGRIGSWGFVWVVGTTNKLYNWAFRIKALKC